LKRAIYGDIVSLYGIKNPQKIEQLLYLLSSIQGKNVSIRTVAQSLGVDFETAELYLAYLKEAHLIYEQRYFAMSGEKVLRKNLKFVINDCGMRNAIMKEEGISGFTVEAVVSQHLNSLAIKNNFQLFYWKNKREVDFVIKTEKKLIPIECKYQNTIPDSEKAPLLEFAEKFKSKRVFLITRNIEKTEDIGGVAVEYLPAHKFLMLDAERMAKRGV
jgi:predicted AAA+ superfamily ATPase